MGVGAKRPLPVFFREYLLNDCRYRHQTFRTPPNINFTHCDHFFKGYDRLATNDVRMTSFSVIFDKKKTKKNRGKSCQAYSFEDTEKCLMHRRYRITRAINLSSQIFVTFGFWPPKSKKLFFGYNNKKSQKISGLKKRNLYDSPYYLPSTHQIWDRYLFFGQVVERKLQNWWGHIFKLNF